MLPLNFLGHTGLLTRPCRPISPPLLAGLESQTMSNDPALASMGALDSISSRPLASRSIGLPDLAFEMQEARASASHDTGDTEAAPTLSIQPFPLAIVLDAAALEDVDAVGGCQD